MSRRAEENEATPARLRGPGSFRGVSTLGGLGGTLPWRGIGGNPGVPTARSLAGAKRPRHLDGAVSLPSNPVPEAMDAIRPAPPRGMGGRGAPAAPRARNRKCLS